MKVLRAVAILFTPAILFAQGSSRSLDLRVQLGVELTRPYESLMEENALTQWGRRDLFAQPDHQVGLQARMLGELPGTRGFYYELGGRIETSSRLNFKYHIFNGYNDREFIDMQDVQISYSYFSFGGAYLWNANFGLSVGAHLEGRVEAISSSGSAFVIPDGEGYDTPIPVTGSASYLRPWARLSLDYTFNNHGKVRPFIGIEGAYPLVKREQRGTRWNLQGSYWVPGEEEGELVRFTGKTQDTRLMEAIAPRGSLAFYFGFRL